MVLFLEKSAKEHDVKCASSLKNVKFLLEKEMTKTQRLDLASEQQLQRSGGGGAESQSLRLCSLYRGLLHMLLSHQSAWMLNGVQMPAPSLHKELQLMEQMVVERNRLYNHAQKQLHQGRRVHGSGQLEQPGPQHAHTHRAQGQTKESNNGLRLPRL